MWAKFTARDWDNRYEQAHRNRLEWEAERDGHRDYGTWTKEEWEQFAAFMRKDRGWE